MSRFFFLDGSFISSCAAVVFVCTTAAIWGSFLLLSKKSLIGETISHASYPGLLIGVIISGFFSCSIPSEILIIICGCLTAILGFFFVDFAESHLGLNRDAALCLVLIVSFGFGVTLACYVREVFPENYAEIQAYLYGQATTLNSFDLVISGFLMIITVLFVLILYRSLLAASLDPEYAFLNKLFPRYIKNIVILFVALVVVVGVRSVGVVLISAMFVGPPLVAKQFSKKLSKFMIVSVISGGVSGLLGCLLSLLLSIRVGNRQFYLPTGPLIVLVSGLMVVGSLLFSRNNGLLPRLIRRSSFYFRRNLENFIKVLWIVSKEGVISLTREELFKNYKFEELFLNRRFFGFIILKWLVWKGFIRESRHEITLSVKGNEEALRLVRLHRLWESYLVGCLSFPSFDVHPLAEEIEHVLTHEMENCLTDLLNDPLYDPHNRLIPKSSRRSSL